MTLGMRRAARLSCFLVVLACGSGKPEPHPPSLPIGDVILAEDPHQAVVVEAVNDFEASLRWEDGATSCKFSREALRSWEIVRAAAEGEPKLVEEWRLDPSEVVRGAIVAYLEEKGDGTYSARHVTGEEAMLSVADALEIIYRQCGAGFGFRFFVVR